MSADQAKLAHLFILVTIAFLYPVDENEDKAHTCHPIGGAVNEGVRGLTGRSWTYFWNVNIKAFLLIVYWRMISLVGKIR